MAYDHAVDMSYLEASGTLIMVHDNLPVTKSDSMSHTACVGRDSEVTNIITVRTQWNG